MFCGCAARCSAAAAAQQILKIGQNDGLAYRNCVLGVYDAAEFKTVVGFAVALRVAALQSRRSKLGKWVKLKVWVAEIWCLGFSRAQSSGFTFALRVSLHAQMPMIVY